IFSEVAMLSPRPNSTPSKLDELRGAANDLIRRGQLHEAEKSCEQLVSAYPAEPDGWILLARIAQRKNEFERAHRHAETARTKASERLDVRLVAAESHTYIGQVAEALSAFAEIERDSETDPEINRQLSALYTQLGRHEAAYRCACRARALAPNSLNRIYLVASAAIAIGELDEAEALLDEIIRTAPDEGDLYYNRATLKKQTFASNHIDELRDRLSTIKPGDPRESPLCFALGKELEDVGEHEASFDAIARGAKARRARLSYNVEATDVAAANDIIQTFDKDWASFPSTQSDAIGPIYVLGLPRSGTTLVDRILSAHSQVDSLGEINDLAYAVIRAGQPAASKNELIRNSAKADMRTLGDACAAAMRGYGERGPFLIDKTPANYLYLGLIAKAMPNAKIIHLRRHPLASCYAMYKTLFRMGYPFSYDLEDIGHYYLAYHRLMGHWRELFGQRIFDVDYEALVDDQESVSRAIIAHCGLPWESACLDFHQSAKPTATASAAQVRQPLYNTSRDQWRTHKERLAPLTKILTEGGVTCD
ncbi:MAG: sulfotransferase, partial [Pseudomonadota bacterium]